MHVRPLEYTITLGAERLPAYRLEIGRTVYALPQCVCEVHPGDGHHRGDAHPDWKPGARRVMPYWTRANVVQLAEHIKAEKGNVAAPGYMTAPRWPHKAKNLVGPRAALCDPSPEKVAELQAMCDLAWLEGPKGN